LPIKNYLLKTLMLVSIPLIFSSLTSAATIADYTTIPNGTYAAISLAGTTVTGSSSVTSGLYAGQRGLGILGAGTLGNGSDLSLDVGETMTISFGQLVQGITATINDIDPPGNVTFGFNAFNGTANLGTFMFPLATVADEVYNVSALDGNLAITSFTIFVLSPSAPLGLQIQGVSYNAAAPEPASGFLCAAAIFASCLIRRSLGRSRIKELNQEALGFLMVGARRFELRTSWSRTRRSTRLSHAPNNL
jgi:hypothetical protein